jgi:hypothetical protein
VFHFPKTNSKRHNRCPNLNFCGRIAAALRQDDDWARPAGHVPVVALGYQTNGNATTSVGPLDLPDIFKPPFRIASLGGPAALTCKTVTAAAEARAKGEQIQSAWMRAPIIANIGAAHLDDPGATAALSKGSLFVVTAYARPVKPDKFDVGNLDAAIRAATAGAMLKHAATKAAAFQPSPLADLNVLGFDPIGLGGAALFPDFIESRYKEAQARSAARRCAFVWLGPAKTLVPPALIKRFKDS